MKFREEEDPINWRELTLFDEIEKNSCLIWETALKEEALRPLLMNRLKIFEFIEKQIKKNLIKTTFFETNSVSDEDTVIKNFSPDFIESVIQDLERKIRMRMISEQNIKHFLKLCNSRFVKFATPAAFFEMIDNNNTLDDLVNINSVAAHATRKKTWNNTKILRLAEKSFINLLLGLSTSWDYSHNEVYSGEKFIYTTPVHKIFKNLVVMLDLI